MKKLNHYLLIIIFLMISMFAVSQQKKNINNEQFKSTQPKLVVGLVIDQMRWDYLYKYKDLYGKDGFKRLMNDGFNCENTLITHLPTYTAVGHAGIYTGSFPAIHGVVGNNWTDRISGKSVYCTDDESVFGVGSNGKEGNMSPKNMLANSIADELRLSNNFKSKAIGISLKDRGAILPAGHAANAAYWFEDSEGKWITSSYYMKELPQWVTKFNDTKQPDSFMKNDWKLLMGLKSIYSMMNSNPVAKGI
jgi:predicted AlkP superfamily pyrophosphatase or phosphodiesterase